MTVQWRYILPWGVSTRLHDFATGYQPHGAPAHKILFKVLLIHEYSCMSSLRSAKEVFNYTLVNELSDLLRLCLVHSAGVEEIGETSILRLSSGRTRSFRGLNAKCLPKWVSRRPKQASTFAKTHHLRRSGCQHFLYRE